jgi:hypothetical protein
MVVSYRRGSRNRTVGNIDKRLILSQLIMGFGESDKVIIDHVNGDTLLNIKKNLRVSTSQQNARNRKRQVNNTSGFTGVKQVRSGKYEARVYDIDSITKERKNIYLGSFECFEDAIVARGDAELSIYGEFAGLYRRTDEMEMYKAARIRNSQMMQTNLESFFDLLYNRFYL